MKHILKYLPLIFSISLIFAACKKEKEALTQIQTDTEVTTHYDDESMVSEELDAIADEANSLLESDPVLSGNNSVVDQLICDADISFNAETDPMSLTVTFNGANCGTKRTRTGVMILTMAKGSEWKNQGAAITVHFENMKVTRKKDGKSITLNGSKVYTNVSGGLIHEAAEAGTIIHTITSDDLTIKFDDGTARNWNVARKKEFTYNNGLVISVTGLHEVAENSGITEWGTNRFGNAFVTSIKSPVIIKQDCSFRVTGGIIQHSTDVFTATATFGLDESGTSTACPGEGKYYYRLGWTKTSNGNNFTILLPY